MTTYVSPELRARRRSAFDQAVEIQALREALVAIKARLGSAAMTEEARIQLHGVAERALAASDAMADKGK